MADDAALALPDDVLSWVGDVAGAPVVHADRIPGGATREAWYVDVADGRPLFVRYSAEATPARSAFHALPVEAEVMAALHAAGCTVPRILGVHPTREAILSERVPGATWFYRITDPAEQVSVAQDFIRKLAQVHALDPRDLAIAGLGPVRTNREHALDRIRAIRWRGTAPDGSIDPLLRISLDWLERNVPDDDGPVVVVQGDTGPGNFLYADGRVTAVLDWELSHLGDPMDDIAWLSLRTVQDTFTHLPDRLAEYTALTGNRIDADRVWYYRVFAECTMVTLRPNDGVETLDEGRPEARDVGNSMIYPQVHRRLWLEALTHVMGLDLARPELPEPDPPSDWHHLYDQVLAMFQVIVPRIDDPLAAQWTKGLARVVKHLQETDVAGRAAEELERADIAALLGSRPASLADARAELATRSAAGAVADDDYVRVLWNRVLRHDHLMRAASGALSRRTWPPLV